MKSKFKKIWVIISIATIVLILAGIFGYFYFRNQNYNDLKVIKENISSQFSKGNAHSISITDIQTAKKTDKSNNSQYNQVLTGKIYGDDFAGENKINDEITSNIVAKDGKIYTQSGKEGWKQDDKTYTYKLNIIEHPQWIQLQKQLDDQEINGTAYLQYQVLFENPNQEILKTMSKEALENLRITGTMLINKKTMELKQIKLHQGKDTSNEIKVEYSALGSVPKIEAPI